MDVDLPVRIRDLLYGGSHVWNLLDFVEDMDHFFNDDGVGKQVAPSRLPLDMLSVHTDTKLEEKE